MMTQNATIITFSKYERNRAVVIKEHFSDPNPKFELVTHGRDAPLGSGLLLYNGGTVCSPKFSVNNAQAICSQIMGYEVSHADVAWISGEKWYQQKYIVKMGNLNCSWHKWSYCSLYEYPECSHEDDIFLTCKFGEFIVKMRYLTRHICKVQNVTVFRKFRHIFEPRKFLPSHYFLAYFDNCGFFASCCSRKVIDMILRRMNTIFRDEL